MAYHGCTLASATARCIGQCRLLLYCCFTRWYVIRPRAASFLFGCAASFFMAQPEALLPDGEGISDDYIWPGGGANFEVGPKVQSFDVPWQWSNHVPLAVAGQTPPPLMSPDGGILSNDTRVTLFLNHSCGDKAKIFYTTNGNMPVLNKSTRYTGPFALRKGGVWFQRDHIVVGAVAVCPQLRPSPVNSRWFYTIPSTPAPVIRPIGRLEACHPVRVNVTGRGALRYTVSLRSLVPPPTANATTESNCECDFPFTYRGESYDQCTEADWPGTPWCYVKGAVCGTPFFNRRFDRCKPFDPFNARLRVPSTDSLVSLLSRDTAMVETSVVQSDSKDSPLIAPNKVYSFRERDEGHFLIPPGHTAFIAAIATIDGALTSPVTESNVTVRCVPTPTPTPGSVSGPWDKSRRSPTTSGTREAPDGASPLTQTVTPTPTPVPTRLPVPTASSTPKPMVTSTPTPVAAAAGMFGPTHAATRRSAPTPTPEACPPCGELNLSAPMPMSYPDRGVIAASMMVRLFSSLGENGTIYYTTDGEQPTVESRKYTTPFYLTEDGQACQPTAHDDTGNSWECFVTLRALVAPARTLGSASACLCMRNSPILTQMFHVLSA